MKEILHRYRGWFRAAAVSLLAIIVLIVLYGMHVTAFNSSVHNQEYSETDSSLHIDIKPKTGESDSWTKQFTDNTAAVVNSYGIIYDVNILNETETIIDKWQYTVRVNQRCFLNNGWCGTFEIHQFRNDKEYAQQLDLRSFDKEDISLVHCFSGSDLLIELLPGDYFTYIADQKAGEYPIKESDLEHDNYNKVNTGFIMYSEAPALDLRVESIRFNATMNYRDGLGYFLIMTMVVIWAFMAAILMVILLMEYNGLKQKLHDAVVLDQSLNVFTEFFDAKDPYTNGHSKRVAEYTRLIAKKLGFSDEEAKNAYYIALMHDCGKCHIPDEILKKPGRLTDDEYMLIKTHSEKGAEMLKNFTSIDGIIDGAMYHHERYDGKGYPSGKASSDIPLIGRIICVADSFDAMNSKRCYREELTKEYIIDELIKNKGKQFDPVIVDVMMGLIEEGVIDF